MLTEFSCSSKDTEKSLDESGKGPAVIAVTADTTDDRRKRKFHSLDAGVPMASASRQAPVLQD